MGERVVERKRGAWSKQHEAIVEQATATARRLGLTWLAIDGVEVGLGPAPTPEMTPAADAPEPPQGCACGHPWTEHNETGCAHGCDLTRCGQAGLEEP